MRLKIAKLLNCYIVIFIVTLGMFLRFYRLGSIPPSLDWDEASLGYNAVALSETGKDEFGNSWPLSIRSFGDYKPPVYTYLLIPAIKIFGRTEFAVRFPSALAGTLMVVATYFLTLELFGWSQRKKFPENSEYSENRSVRYSDNQKVRFSGLPSFPSFPKVAAVVTALLLAISPWHLQFSRIAFEANVGLMFFVTGMWLLIRALRRNLPWSLFLAVVSMSLGMMSYHSLRLVTPLVVLGILWVYRSEPWILLRFNLAVARLNLFRQSLPLILSAILTILTISTISYTVFFQNVGQSRFKETSFLTIDDLMTVSWARIENSGGNFLDRAVNHRFLVYGRQYLRGYFDHYNLRFLFLDGDSIDRHRTPGIGLMYWWELPLLIMGLIRPIRLISAKEKALLFLWLLLAPSAAALTGGTPSAVRSLIFLPVFQIVEALGLIWLISRISQIRRIWKIPVTVFCFLFSVFWISYYFHQYYLQAPPETAPAWQYGYKQLISRIMDEKDNYDKVIVTTAYDQPYIYFLWYGNYNPKFWVNDGEFNKRFDKFEFRKIEWGDLGGREKTLVISSPDETKGKPVKWQINFPDGKTAFNATQL